MTLLKNTLLALVLIFSNSAATQLDVMLTSLGWKIRRDRPPFEGVTMLEKRGVIALEQKDRFKETNSDSFYCTLLLSTTILAIEYPFDTKALEEREDTFSQNSVFQFNNEMDKPKLVGAFRCLFTEIYDNRSLALLPSHNVIPLLREIQTKKFRTVYVYLQTLPERRPGQHPAELIKQLKGWTFKFDLTGIDRAIKVLIENTRQ